VTLQIKNTIQNTKLTKRRRRNLEQLHMPNDAERRVRQWHCCRLPQPHTYLILIIHNPQRRGIRRLPELTRKKKKPSQATAE